MLVVCLNEKLFVCNEHRVVFCGFELFHYIFDGTVFVLVVEYVLCKGGLKVIVSDISYMFLIALF
jgi:hypothetical protein